MRQDERLAFEALKKSLAIVRKKSELDALVQTSVAGIVERCCESLSAAGRIDDLRAIAKAAGVVVDTHDANGAPRSPVDVARDVLRGPGTPVFRSVAGANKSATVGSLKAFETLIADASTPVAGGKYSKGRVGGALRK